MKHCANKKLLKSKDLKWWNQIQDPLIYKPWTTKTNSIKDQRKILTVNSQMKPLGDYVRINIQAQGPNPIDKIFWIPQISYQHVIKAESLQAAGRRDKTPMIKSLIQPWPATSEMILCIIFLF